jgi:4-hydroxy-3-methylbut-2-enyl diphosphate reductase
MKSIKINLAKSAGFCFGVRRALDIAFKTADTSRKVYMLGDIVHNEDVVRQVKKAGIKKINRLTQGNSKVLLIRAHGEPLGTFEKAHKLGYKIIDATCPMVKEIHKIAKNFAQKGYKIIVIGDKRHDEVRGIAGQIKSKALIIDSAKAIPLRTIKRISKACVVVQSTQNLEKVLKIVDFLKPQIKGLKFFNTICMPTRMKQAEIKKISRKNDVMIIIGSKTSANTKRLYEISRSLNKHNYWVSNKKEIRNEWFRGAKNVGVTAGASTPDSTTQDVIAFILNLSGE